MELKTTFNIEKALAPPGLGPSACPDREFLREFYFYPDREKHRELFSHVSLCFRCSGFIIQVEEAVKTCAKICFLLTMRRNVYLNAGSEETMELVASEVKEREGQGSNPSSVLQIRLWREKGGEYPQNTFFVEPQIENRPLGYKIFFRVYNREGKDVSKDFRLKGGEGLSKILKKEKDHILWFKYGDKEAPLQMEITIKDE